MAATVCSTVRFCTTSASMRDALEGAVTTRKVPPVSSSRSTTRGNEGLGATCSSASASCARAARSPTIRSTSEPSGVEAVARSPAVCRTM